MDHYHRMSVFLLIFKRTTHTVLDRKYFPDLLDILEQLDYDLGEMRRLYGGISEYYPFGPFQMDAAYLEQRCQDILHIVSLIDKSKNILLKLLTLQTHQNTIKRLMVCSQAAALVLLKSNTVIPSHDRSRICASFFSQEKTQLYNAIFSSSE